MTKWPPRLMIDLTWKCNLRCFMCTMHMHDRPGEGMSAKHPEMPDEIFLKVEPIIEHASEVTLAGCGEPFVSSNVLDRMRRIRSLNSRAKTITYTNGTRLADRRFAAEAMPLLDEVHLSLDGVASYEEIHIGNRFANVLAALESVREVRTQHDGRPNFVVEFILMRRNRMDIVPAAKLALESGASRIVYKDMWSHNEEHLRQSPRHDPALAEEIRQEIRKAHEVGLPVWCDAWPELSWPPPGPARAETGPPCQDPWNLAHILVDGVVFLCCGGQTRIGHLAENDFESIWNGEEAQRYREGILTGRYYKDCATCPRTAPADPAAYERYI